MPRLTVPATYTNGGISMCDCCDYVAAHGGTPGDPALTAKYELIWRGRITDHIRRFGVSVVAVEDEWPWLSYTIGLSELDQPELVIFGVEPRPAMRLLNAMAEPLVRGDVRICDGDEIQHEHWRFRAFAVPNPDDVIPRAGWFFRRSVPALQLIYPDAHGTWPWEPGCRLSPGQQPFPGTTA